MKIGKNWQWIAVVICVIILFSIGYIISWKWKQNHDFLQKKEMDEKLNSTDVPHEETSSEQSNQPIRLQDLGRQNIISDGECLYTIHKQDDDADLVQIFRIEETKLIQLWSICVGAEARMSVNGGEFTVIYPQNEMEEHVTIWDVSDPDHPQEIRNDVVAVQEEAGEAAAMDDGNDSMITAEYPFGEDLTLLLEALPSEETQVRVSLIMMHTSTGERLQEQVCFVQNSDWLERMAENIIVDHQHCYIGIGCQNEQGHSIYELYHYNETDGFQELMQYDWGKTDNTYESCGWIRGNDVYFFSPDGQKSMLYDVVSEKLKRE